MLIEILSRYLLDPVGIAILILVGALVAERYERRKLARGLVAGTALFLAAFYLLPLDDMLARPLENKYPRPALPAHVDGIVVLSGGVKPNIYASRGVMADNGSVMRMIAGAELARRYPAARFVFSGSTGGGPRMQQAEFASVEQFYRSLGVAPGRTIIERNSLDTSQNLRFTKKLVNPKPGETWVLVTSAMHMPRAMAVANGIGWKMVPWPSDYDTTADWHMRNWKAPSDGLLTVNHALHEWIGRLVYAVTGRGR
jgi:uncharacterized SAM-binding protein YcdF (DUF218 family)